MSLKVGWGLNHPQPSAGKLTTRRSSCARLRSLPLAPLLVLIALLVFASPSLAARPRALKETLGASGSGAGQLQLRAAGEGVAGSGVAVNDSTHDVYVADTGNHRIDEFDPLLPAAEQFVRAWGWGVDEAKPEARLQECTTATGCLPGTSGSAPGEFEAPAFITVDSAPGGEGDVYIGDTRDNVVSKFTPEGELLKLWGMDGQLNGSTTLAGSFGPLAGIAVNSTTGTLAVLSTNKQLFQFEQNGTFLAPEIETGGQTRPRGLAGDPPSGGFFDILEALEIPSGHYRPFELTATGEGVTEVGCASCAEQVTAATAIATTPSELYVTEPEVVKLFALSGSGEALEPAVEEFGKGTIGAAAGIAVDPANENIYVTDAASSRVDVFALEAPSPPAVLSESVSEVSDDSALFSAEIDPRSLTGETVTEYSFEYGACATPTTCASSAYPSTVPGGIAGRRV